MEDGLKDQLFRTMFRFRKLSPSMPPGVDLRSGEFFLMNGIAIENLQPDSKCNLSEIHTNLHITKAAVSQMLNTLEKKGYILREIDRTDRRKISVTLTPQGDQILRQSRAYADDRMNKVISRFGVENMKQLISLLTKLADISEEMGNENIEAEKGESKLD